MRKRKKQLSGVRPGNNGCGLILDGIDVSDTTQFENEKYVVLAKYAKGLGSLLNSSKQRGKKANCKLVWVPDDTRCTCENPTNALLKIVPRAALFELTRNVSCGEELLWYYEFRKYL